MAAIFKPPIPETWQECFYTTLYKNAIYSCPASMYLYVKVGWDCNASGLGHFRQRPDAVLHVDPLVDGEPRALRHAERRPQELNEDRLTRLKENLVAIWL